METCTHTHGHAHAHARTHTRTDMHTRTRAHTHGHAHARTPANALLMGFKPLIVLGLFYRSLCCRKLIAMQVILLYRNAESVHWGPVDFLLPLGKKPALTH